MMSTSTLWSGSFPIKGGGGLVTYLLLPWFTEISVLKANSVDPEQTPLSAASDLGLCCLRMSFLWDTRHKCVKILISVHIVLLLEKLRLL